MNRASYNLPLLFGNMAHLLSVDLEQYNLKPIEKKYFDATVELFFDASNIIKELSDNKEPNITNLTSFYAISEINSIISKRKALIKLFDNSQDEDVVLLRIGDLLNSYFAGNKLDDFTRNSLRYFFENLADVYSVNYHFEKLETLEVA